MGGRSPTSLESPPAPGRAIIGLRLWPVIAAAGCAADGAAIDGAASYARHCAACHGALGLGIDGVAPPIAGMAPEAVRPVVRSGRDVSELYVIGMPAFGVARLPDDELDALMAFVEAPE